MNMILFFWVLGLSASLSAFPSVSRLVAQTLAFSDSFTPLYAAYLEKDLHFLVFPSFFFVV